MIAPTMAVAAVSQSSQNTAKLARAARRPRVWALIADTIVYSVILSVANSVYGVTTVAWGSPLPIGASGYASFGTQTSISWGWSSLVYLAYFIAWEAVFGATPGKLLLGIRVVGIEGRPITLRAALIRNLVRVADALPVLYLLGGFSVLATTNSQRLGDIAAGTVVIDKRDAPSKPLSASSKAIFFGALAAVLVFTAAFDYFGRPALFIEGQYNTHQLMGLTTYSLGPPTWGVGTVTYPITGRTATASCTGWIQLDWDGLAGWQMHSATLNCPPS